MKYGVLALGFATALVALALWTALDHGTNKNQPDSLSLLPTLASGDILTDLDNVLGPPRTVTEVTTTVTATGEVTTETTKQYRSGFSTRIDTLNEDGSVATSLLNDGGIIECDWTAKTCRTVLKPALLGFGTPLSLRTRERGATARPSPDFSHIDQLPTARVTESKRTLLGEHVTCVLRESPYGDRETCATDDRIILFERKTVNGTTTTTVATELLRFIPYEAVGLPFPLDDEQE